MWKAREPSSSMNLNCFGSVPVQHPLKRRILTTDYPFMYKYETLSEFKTKFIPYLELC
jgi:hypothetical protein